MRKIVIAAILGAVAGQAVAQTNSIDPAAQNAVDGATVSFTMTYNEGAPPMSGVTGRADVNGAVGDTATFDAASLMCTAGTGFSCNVVAGVATCSGFQVGSTFADGSQIAACTVDLTAGATPGDVATIQSLVQADSFSDMGGTDFMGAGTNGTVTITAGSTLVNDTAAQNISAGTNSTSPTRDFSFRADGGDVTGITCVDDAAGDGVLWAFNAPAGTLAQDATFTVTGSCDTMTNGMTTSTATCSGTGDQSNPTMATATLTCDIASQPEMPDVSATSITLGPAAPNTTAFGSFQVIDREPSSVGFNVTGCTAMNGNVTLSNTTGMVSPGNPLTVQVSATALPGVTDSITCTTDSAGTPTVGPVSVSVLLQALRVPTLSQWAMILMALALAGFGVYRIRRGGFSA